MATVISTPSLYNPIDGAHGPADIRRICRNTIIPIVSAAGLTWKPLKGGRTGAATEATHRVGVSLAQALLGHADSATTTAVYVKAMPQERFREGMRALTNGSNVPKVPLTLPAR